MMKLRIVKDGKTGEYFVERKRLWFWTAAIVSLGSWGGIASRFDTIEAAKDSIEQIYGPHEPDEIVEFVSV